MRSTMSPEGAYTGFLFRCSPTPNHKGERIRYPENFDPARKEGANAVATSTDNCL